MSKSSAETKVFARKLLKRWFETRERPIILALKGNLGSGKTTFVQGLARALGLGEKIKSPTFVLMKFYALPKRVAVFRHMIHIDAYRIKKAAEIKHLGFGDLLKDKDAIIVIEWADKIKKLIPKTAIWIQFTHGRGNTRSIEIKNLL